MSKRCLGCMELYGDEFQICPYCGYVEGTHAEEAIHMEPGTLLHDRYIIGKVLGFGGFGVTYLGWDGRLQQKVAIKEYLPSEFSTRMPGQSQVTVFSGDRNEQFHDGLKKFVEEAKHLAKFQNEPGIVRIFDSFEENDTAYIIMEYLDGETLTSYLDREGSVPEDQAVQMLMPLMESLQTVHAEGLLHRDIAPDNIFLTKSGEIKLIDFGASRYATTSHSRSLTVIIKPGYSPEEQYRSRGDQGPHTDVYALGATLYKMITGKTPPDAMERRAKYENQNKDILIPPHKLTKNISPNREIAILNAMNVRIEDRTPDVAAFLGELNADPPAKRIYGKIKKLNLYTLPLWLKITVPTVLALAVAFAALMLTGVINFSSFTEEVVIPEGIVVVPELEGTYKDEAIKQAEGASLLVATGGTVESAYVPAGKIILQTPIGGTYIHKNGTVYLTVSSGGSVQGAVDHISIVPFVTWDSQEDALEKLKMAGLGEPILEEAFDDNVEAGHVISQSVESGTKVDENTVITLVISKGVKAFAIPDVAGMDFREAEKLLTSKGLVVSLEYEKNLEVKENSVIRQSVPQGTEVMRGDSVSLVVSSGKPTVKLQDTVGMESKAAVEALKQQGFEVTVLENYSTDVEKGKVISMTPEAGTSQVPGSMITVYVSKGRQPVTVHFKGNGGSPDRDSMTVYLGASYGELPSASRSGYRFAGWYTSEDGGSRIKSGSTVSNSGNHTLYAHWDTGTYTVSFDGNGGKAGSGSKTVTYRHSYGELPSASRDGCEFAGWYTEESGGSRVTSSSNVEKSYSHTLYAHWNPKSYTVKFDGNGGRTGAEPRTVTFTRAYGELPTASREGFAFAGWYTAADGGSKVTASSNVRKAENHTLYAHWDPNSYTVTFDGNGGTPGSGSKKVTYTKTYGQLPGATRDDFALLGWFTKADGGEQVTDGTKVSVMGDHTLYAHWTSKTFSLSFDGNGGTAGSQSKDVTLDKTYGQLPGAERAGYTFDGWFTRADGGSKITESTQVKDASIRTLYAHWTAKTYTLNLNANGGSVSGGSKNVACGSAYGNLPTPTRDYCNFEGWFTEASGGSQVSADTKMGAGDVTVYAHWSDKPLSDWVPAEQAPGDAQIVEQKWTYSEKQTMESGNASESGWNQTGSYWKEGASNSRKYASFPGGFDHGHWIYGSYASGPVEAYENETSKRVVSNNWSNYVYWHWMFDCGNANGHAERAIYHKYGRGPDNNFLYKFFGAFESTRGDYRSDLYYCNSQSIRNYIVPERTAYSECQGATRWFRFDAYVSNYTDYTKTFQYERTVDGQESPTEVQNGGNISNVQKYVRYRSK